MRVYYVYKIINLISGKSYIGKHTAKTIENNYFGSGIAIKAAIQKYGLSNFKKEILEICPTQDITATQEKVWIRTYGTIYPAGYNLSEGGDGGNNFIHSPNRKESIRKISEKNKGRKHSEEVKQLMSIKRLGISQTPCGKVSCLYCQKEIDIRNFFKWHGNNCNKNPFSSRFKVKKYRSTEFRDACRLNALSQIEKSTEIFTCLYCNKTSKLKMVILNHHNDKCKHKINFIT